jgi:hypothetical protein
MDKEFIDDKQLFRTTTLKRNQSRQLQFQHKLKEAKQWIEKVLDVELLEDSLVLLQLQKKLTTTASRTSRRLLFV